MNNNLRNLQSSIQIALDDTQVTPKQIAEVVRETLRMEASKARDVVDKAEEALSELEPSIGSFGLPYDVDSNITFSPAATDTVSYDFGNLGGAFGRDIISF